MIEYVKKKLNIFLFIIIGISLFIIHKQYETINSKEEEIYLLENITEEFNVSLQNIEINNNNDNNDNNDNNKLLDCPKCENKWTGPPCPDCKECPQFYNDKIIYKDLITRYKIEFPDYDMLHNKEKNILEEIFKSDNKLPDPNIDREYFPYNVFDTKVNMENVIPSMA
jgi:hypothetical protein